MNNIVFHYMLAKTLFKQAEGREEANGGNRNASPLRGVSLSIKSMLGWGLAVCLAVALFYLGVNA